MNQQEQQTVQTNIIAITMINEPEIVPIIMTREEPDTEPIYREDNNISSAPESLIHSLCSTLKELKNKDYLLFPIKKICNLNVEVCITKEQHYSCTIYILNIKQTQFKVDQDDRRDFLYKIVYKGNEDAGCNVDNFTKNVVINLLSQLKKIRIDKLNGNLNTNQHSTKYQKIDEMWAEFLQEFKDDKHIEMMNECCVCFTMTKTTTNCLHSVCLECISKFDDTITNNVNHKSCPMCRQHIHSLYSKDGTKNIIRIRF
jgi:hypothetical protein